MKLFEIPMVVTSLVSLGFLAGLDAPARADFAFGTPVDLRTVIPSFGLADEGPDCLSYDGLEMYIESDRPGGYGSYDLWVLKRASVEADWGLPENLGPLVNGASDDSASFISADGLELYFNSGRPGGYGDVDLYVTKRATPDSPWGQSANLGPALNSSYLDALPSVSPDGLELYFNSRRPGGYGDNDLFVSKRATRNDPWGDPVNLGPVVNSPANDAMPRLSPDGLLMFFASFRPGGYGSYDFWMVRRANGSAPWQPPVHLGPTVNTSGLDFLPIVAPDGSTLYFTRFFGTGASWMAPITPIVDFNGDGKVDAADLAILPAEMGKENSVCDIGPYPWGDGVVDDKDLKSFMDYSMTPGSRASDVVRDVILSWVSLSPTNGYDVYLGTSQEAVKTASRTNPQDVLVSQEQSATSYAPAQPLEFSTTYYWRVDEVNTVTRPGEVWSFTTVYYPDSVVDDFESYAISGKDLFSTWIDGYFVNFTTNGAMVGLLAPVNGTFCESTIVHGGKQSLPLVYDNSNAPLSEAVRTFDHAQDWTAGDIKTLSLWFRGVAGNAGQLYVKMNSTKVPYDGAASNLAEPAWAEWRIDLSKVTGVNKVSSLTIGIEGAGAKGALYLDDICLTP